jgi:putative ABC transport system permease protein
MESVLKDIRYALRTLWQRPGFTVVAVVTIGLGVGSVTALFSVVNAVVLSPLPYDAPEELVRVWSSNAERGVALGFVSPPDIVDFQEMNRTLTGLAAYSEAELALIDQDGAAVKATGTWAGDNLFTVLGVGPLVGRVLTPADGEPGAEKVVVLSHGFWQTRFGGSSAALGQSITVEDAPYTIVGVMPPGFDFPGSSQFWANRYLLDYPGRYARWMDVVARAQPGVDIEAVRADLANVALRLEEEYPRTNRAYSTTVVPLHEAVVGETKTTLIVLLGATGFLLLIACVNVINLLLSRMADRGQEIALRTALGAGRGRLGRQLMTESLVLAGVGAAVGLGFAGMGIEALSSFGPENLPRLDEISLDSRVLLFALAVTSVTGILFGLAPLLRLYRTDVQATLQEGSKGSTSGGGRERMRSLLVITEVALAVILVVGAGLLSKSFSRLLSAEPGFDAENVLTLQMDLPSGSYRDLQKVADYYGILTARIEGLPGVASTAATAALPFDREIPFLGNFLIQDRVTPKQGEEPRAHYRQVTPGFFQTMGIDLLTGRDFDSRDDGTSPGVAIVNESLAAAYFPNEDPIGRVIEGLPPHVALGGFLAESFEIIGVAQDVKYFGLAEDSQPSLYLPIAQAPFRRMYLAVRTQQDPDLLMAAVRSEIAALDVTVPVSRVSTAERILSNSVARERFSTMLLSLFAAVALILAVVGIYGVTSYAVTQRTAEMGIRMAIGAEPGDVLRMVLLEGVRLTLTGVAVGLAGAWGLSRLMASQLYGISATDPTTFAWVAVALSAVAFVAAYVPALRAARMDPVLALQGEGR